jgi:very-short-patch-repair endonuclease
MLSIVFSNSVAIYFNMPSNPDRQMFRGATADTFRFAASLRASETYAEKLLWRRLKMKQLGFRFKRQHPIAEFIVDFYCPKAQLVVEVDGNAHDNSRHRLYDEERTKAIERYGLTVVRIRNEEIIHDIEKVIAKIAQFLPV